MSLHRLGLPLAVLGLAAAGTALIPGSAKAWWAGGGGWGWHGGFSVGVFAPPVYVAPPPVYVAPPPVVYAPPPPTAYYAPPRPGPVWVPGHWQGGYWVPAHWA